jgi:GT2 family glycosyltransferase
MSISILIATIGKTTLKAMLESLKNQLKKEDNLYVVVDGKEYFDDFNCVISSFKNYDFNLKIIYEKKNLGYWGHGIRNKYQKKLKGDYIMHADDDDIYVDGAIDLIKNYIEKNDYETMMLFKFFLTNKNDTYWKDPELRFSNIGTPCGVIPNIPEKMGKWGKRRGGDFDFYNSCKFNYKFIDELIYCAKPMVSKPPMVSAKPIIYFL